MPRPSVANPPDLPPGVVVAQGGDDAASLIASNPALSAGVIRADEGDLSRATDSLRRVRLRAAASFLMVAMVVTSAWRLITFGPEMIGFQTIVFTGMAVALLVLWSEVELSTRWLRALEFWVFGLTAAYLAARQYHIMNLWADEGKESEVYAAVKTVVVGTILIIFTYCMLIPNTWQAAARVVVAMAALPLATELLLLVSHPAAVAVAWKFATLEHVGEDVINMLIAGSLSVYGTYLINALRSEAFEAQQLNQYRLGRRLGTGGMGEVYLAEHRLLKRPCALKLIRPGSANPVVLARFEREVRAPTAALAPQHRRDLRLRPDRAGHVLLRDGISPRPEPRRPGRPPRPDVSRPGDVYLLRQVLRAGRAHAAGLIHRDVKPANILACHRGGTYDVAKLLDFGLVKGFEVVVGDSVEAEPGEVKSVCGTPLYMSPEQITRAPELDHRCDLYALGAVGYKLLTGNPPFPGSRSSDVLSGAAPATPSPRRDGSGPRSRRIRTRHPSAPGQVAWRLATATPPPWKRALAACAAANEWNAAEGCAMVAPARARGCRSPGVSLPCEGPGAGQPRAGQPHDRAL